MARSFAHLVGLGRRASAPSPRAAEETDDQKREREATEQRERDEEARRMEDNGEDTGETEDEREERHKREAASRRAASAEDGEDEEGDADSDKEEARGHGTVARARRRERGRIAAILSSPQAAANVPLAVDLACNTTMSRDEAVRVLARAPAPARTDRSARNPNVGSGRGLATGSPDSRDVQTMWGEALARAVPALRSAQRR